MTQGKIERYHRAMKSIVPLLLVLSLPLPALAGDDTLLAEVKKIAGDGVVVERGHRKGNGRYVRIRHTNREDETYYLHFSRFARGLAKGKHVRQGDVIGYVDPCG